MVDGRVTEMLNKIVAWILGALVITFVVLGMVAGIIWFARVILG